MPSELWYVFRSVRTSREPIGHLLVLEVLNVCSGEPDWAPQHHERQSFKSDGWSSARSDAGVVFGRLSEKTVDDRGAPVDAMNKQRHVWQWFGDNFDFMHAWQKCPMHEIRCPLPPSRPGRSHTLSGYTTASRYATCSTISNLAT